MESNHRYTVLQTAALTTWLPWEGLQYKGFRLSPPGPRWVRTRSTTAANARPKPPGK